MTQQEPRFDFRPVQSFTASDFADMIEASAVNADDLLALVIAIDEAAADLEFSEKLRDHLIKVCAEEYLTTDGDPQAMKAVGLLSVLRVEPDPVSVDDDAEGPF